MTTSLLTSRVIIRHKKALNKQKVGFKLLVQGASVFVVDLKEKFERMEE